METPEVHELVVAHAEATGQQRIDVEAVLKRRVPHPEPDAGAA
ncbi:hypothetical protein ACGH2B_24895 [Streptomyces sp. BBFR2]